MVLVRSHGARQNAQQSSSQSRDRRPEEHRTRGVAVIGNETAAAGQPPDEETVHRAGPEPSAYHQGTGFWARRQQPLQLGRTEVRVQAEPGLLPYTRVPTGLAELVATLCRPPALPHDGVSRGAPESESQRRVVSR